MRPVRKIRNRRLKNNVYMAKDTYKKRAKGNWMSGKGYKGDNEERQYAKTEVGEMLKEMDEDYSAPYKKGKRRRNERARLEHSIKWYEQSLAKYENMGWKGSMVNYMRDGLREARKEYREKYGKE